MVSKLYVHRIWTCFFGVKLTELAFKKEKSAERLAYDGTCRVSCRFIMYECGV